MWTCWGFETLSWRSLEWAETVGSTGDTWAGVISPTLIESDVVIGLDGGG
jgi:hypothetical protein